METCKTNSPPSASPDCRSRTATSRCSATSASPSATARSSASSARTAPARPRRSRRSRGCAGATPARSRCSGSTRSPTTIEIRKRHLVGAQLQSSALPDRIKVGEALRLFATLAGDIVDWRELRDRWNLGQLERRSFGGAVRRAAPASVPRPRARQPAAAGLPRRADPGPRRRRPPRDVGPHRGRAGRRHDRRARHPLHGRGRAPVRPHRRPPRRPTRIRRTARRPRHRRRRSGACAIPASTNRSGSKESSASPAWSTSGCCTASPT